MNSQIILIALFFAVLPLTSAQSHDKKPNILVIFPDDVGWQNISAYGHGTMGQPLSSWMRRSRLPNTDWIGSLKAN